MEIQVDGVTMSRSYTLPRHRSKVKHGKSDSSDNLYPWLFALTQYEDTGGSKDSSKPPQRAIPNACLAQKLRPWLFPQLRWRTRGQSRLISTSRRRGRSGTIRCGRGAVRLTRRGRLQ